MMCWVDKRILLEGVQDLLVNFLWSLCGVDTADKLVIEGGENVVAFLEVAALFEFVGLAIAHSDTRERGV